MRPKTFASALESKSLESNERHKSELGPPGVEKYGFLFSDTWGSNYEACGMSNDIGELHKGAVFLAELKLKLLREGFTIAVPEPDSGDDLWIVDLNCDSPRLMRCQVKSSLPTQREGSDQKYLVNFTKSSTVRLTQEFCYLIGLYDPRLVIDKFHVGCMPSKYFQVLNDYKHLRWTGQGRTMFDFFLSDAPGYPKFTLRLAYQPASGKARGRGNRADISQFFLPDGGNLKPALQQCGKWDNTVSYAPSTGRKRGPKPKIGAPIRNS